MRQENSLPETTNEVVDMERIGSFPVTDEGAENWRPSGHSGRDGRERCVLAGRPRGTNACDYSHRALQCIGKPPRAARWSKGMGLSFDKMDE